MIPGILIGLLLIVVLTIAAASSPAVWEAVFAEQEQRKHEAEHHGAEFINDHGN